MYAKDELLNSDNDRRQLAPTVTLDLCVLSQGYSQLTFTGDQIQLSSLSQNSIQVEDCLQKLQVMFQPSLILKLSNMILSRCGALVSFQRPAGNRRNRASKD
ncbi:hypothetical protein MalM14_33080 [Gimesia chilikensis]|nr:hypothetical protein MalM14_33080 [Gimesia chilikensis]